MMWDEIINLAIGNGLWAVLFLMLLVFVLKDSRTREQKYQDTIENLGNALQVVQDVKQDVEEIKTTISSFVSNSKEKLEKDEKNNK